MPVIQEKENPNDSNERTIRAFTNASRRFGTVRKVKGRRFFAKKDNSRKRQDKALRSMKRKAEYEQGIKDGSIKPKPRFGRRR